MKLIKVGDYIINLAEIAYVEFKVEYRETNNVRRRCRDAHVHLKGLQGRLFSGGMNADDHSGSL